MADKIEKLSPKASISLQLMSQATQQPEGPQIITRAFSMARSRPSPVAAERFVNVIVETQPNKDVRALLGSIGARQIEEITPSFISASIPISKAEQVYGGTGVRFVEAVKEKKTLLEAALVDGAVGLPANRLVSENGTGVVVGIVDTGFDLSHPMFRDAQGKLRVDALRDQNINKDFTAAQLTAGWAPGGARPGQDTDGHGTHVASIAGGSPFGSISGVAPAARFVLVRTDFERIANAVKWCFDQAGQRPCVVNLSLGGHFGGHDGTSVEERVLANISGSGRVVVIAAGNERDEDVHIGGRFMSGQAETAVFDIKQNASPQTVLTLWYDRNDTFDIMLVSSSGVQLALPPVGRSATHRTDGATVRLGRNVSAASHSVQVQIAIEFHNGAQSFDRLRGWKLVVTCRAATVGRFDGWMAGDRLARFRQGPLNETSRTIGMPATSNNVIAVASHVSKNKWQSDLGPQTAPAAVIARSSRFSSKGPTRDGRQKPEISAPGEMITAALAIPSESTEEKDRADSGAKLLTIEGTSMATPFVTGAVALLLQRDPTLTPERIIQLLRSTAVKDQHTGPADWTPEYGHGKISVRQMVQGLQQLSPGQPAPATVALAQPGAAKPPKASRRRAKAPT